MGMIDLADIDMETAVIDIQYRPRRPSGYTDDLGIIADRNQWVSEQVRGWYVFAGPGRLRDILTWLEENDILYTRWALGVIIFNKADTVLFKLRWS
jgi:hypothetical protein